MKKLLLLQILIFASVLFTFCSVEDHAELKADNIDEALLTANITHNQLLGTWEISQMVTEEPVDLNGDEVYNKNLLVEDETDCFKPMTITFNENKTFSSINARMDFRAGETDDKFDCMGTGLDSGTWEINGNFLDLKMIINETPYERRKEITLSENKLSFKVEKWESEKYVTNDPTGTAVEHVTIVKLEYTLPPK